MLLAQFIPGRTARGFHFITHCRYCRLTIDQPSSIAAAAAASSFFLFYFDRWSVFQGHNGGDRFGPSLRFILASISLSSTQKKEEKRESREVLSRAIRAADVYTLQSLDTQHHGTRVSSVQRLVCIYFIEWTRRGPTVPYCGWSVGSGRSTPVGGR